MKAPESLLPQSKFDSEAIDRLELLSPQELLPLAEKLLTWLQDINWPIAPRVAKLLAPHVADIEAPLLKVFASDDGMWEMWVISDLLRLAPDSITPALQQALQRIATSPTPDELTYEVHEFAQELLDDLAAS